MQGTATVTPNEPGGTYTLTGSFSGDTTSFPTLLPSTGKSTFTENKAPTVVTYTGSTAPTGAFSFQVDSGATSAATCTGASSPLTCTASYAVASLIATLCAVL